MSFVKLMHGMLDQGHCSWRWRRRNRVTRVVCLLSAKREGTQFQVVPQRWQHIIRIAWYCGEQSKYVIPQLVLQVECGAGGAGGCRCGRTPACHAAERGQRCHARQRSRCARMGVWDRTSVLGRVGLALLMPQGLLCDTENMAWSPRCSLGPLMLLMRCFGCRLP